LAEVLGEVSEQETDVLREAAEIIERSIRSSAGKK
jgi:GMP synthase PP-ATPase subunit